MSKVEIVLDAIGNGTVAVEGNDISPAIRGFTLTGKVGWLPQLRLDLVADTTYLTGEMDVRMPDAVYELLLKAGWTPPPSTGTRLELAAPSTSETQTAEEAQL